MTNDEWYGEDWTSVPRYDLHEMRKGRKPVLRCDDCGHVMAETIAETIARDPFFYSGTFCVGCRAHFPVGMNGEFVWDGTAEKVGT